MDSLWNIINTGKQLISYAGLTRKMQILKRKRDSLCSREADIITQLQQEESSSIRKRSAVQNQSARSKQLVDDAKDLSEEVLTLHAHDEVELLTTKLVGQSFERNLEIIWETLKKDDVSMIGICGIGGVGKTTLAKHIYNRIQEHSDTSDHVYWINVSQNLSIHKLQDDIGRAIHFNVAFEDDEKERAALLSRELSRRKRSTLVLDDVWNDVHLAKVGIPVAENGCKLVITSRSLDVCRRLGCQETIKIKPLCEEEAWDLFSNNLRNQKMALSTKLLEVAECIVRECAGLPLGIVTAARCMRGVDDICEWRNALQALRESKEGLIEMEEQVFQLLKFSYTRLNDKKVQQCLLYCALFPKDYEIGRERLIQYLIAEGLAEKFDRAHAILNKLVNSSLLEAVKCDVDYNIVEGVKMHDLVRDMALKMASSHYMVKAGMQLQEIPEEQEWSKEVERVSLMDNKIEEIPSGTSPSCPKLLTLLLAGNHSLKRIESSFFKHMLSLQNLNLSYCNSIEELPDSVSNLKNLTSLVLCGCTNLQPLPSLAQLKSLKCLDLNDSGIREAPHGLKSLVNLVFLDLSLTKLEVFPSGILPKLSQLEYLKFDHWGVKIKGEELRRLERLSTFQGHLIFDSNAYGFKEYVMSRRKFVGPSCRYNFMLDDGDKTVEKTYSFYGNLNQVRIERWSISKRAREDVNVDVETLEALVKDVQSLSIVECQDARSLCDLWWLDNATQDLRRCYINNCEGIECVGSFSNPSSSSFPHFFHTLEKLRLEDLRNLHILFDGEGEGEGEFRGDVPISRPPAFVARSAVFSCLKELYLWECPKITKLFHPGFLPNLRNLERIKVVSCSGLEEIISTAESEEASSISHSYSTVVYTLPKLNSLSLSELPKLKSICDETISCASLRELKVVDCPKLKRIPLSVSSHSLRSINVGGLTPKEWWESVEWDRPNAKNFFLPYLQFRGGGEKFDAVPDHSISYSKDKAGGLEDW